MRHPLLTVCLALALAGHARAADPPAAPPDEIDALDLADKVPQVQQQAARPWRLFIEGAAGRNGLATGGDVDRRRLALDLRVDGRLAPGLRAVLSNRLDLVHEGGDPPADDVNTLREAYLSWSPGEHQVVDVGRVNVRNDAAMGYNPTDWFKENALRSVVSLDPALLRENRQGTVVLQGQQLWGAGSLTALFSPKLATSPDPDTFALDAGATNPRHRWLLAGRFKLVEALSPQLLLYGGEGQSTQLGMNLSAAAGDATVLFAELAVGKGRSLQSQALGLTEDERRQRRAALGLTYTTAFNLTLTVEAEYNSAGPTGDEWHALPARGPGARLQLLATADALQDLPARQAWFVYASWKDLLVRRLDLSAFVRREGATGSRAQWLEVHYRWDQVDLSLQWRRFSGDPGSIYRSLPVEQAVEAALRYYF